MGSRRTSRLSPEQAMILYRCLKDRESSSKEPSGSMAVEDVIAGSVPVSRNHQILDAFLCERTE